MSSSFQNPADEAIAEILQTQKRFAIVGASHKPARPVYRVMEFLLARDFALYPVNPGLAGKDILGQQVYGRLEDIPHPVDVVDIFRNADAALEIVRAAIPLTPAVIWMQLGVVNIEAAALAKTNGMEVIMDRCPKMEYARLVEV